MDSASEPTFIRHVGLSNEERADFGRNDGLSLTEMRPPLERGDGPQSIQAAGSAGLGVDEIRQMEVFIDERMSEYEAASAGRRDQYQITPHVGETRAEDGTLICCRYSCAGFVIEAYRYVEIDLLRTSDAELPPVTLQKIKTAYPGAAGILDRPRQRGEFGLTGDGPWPVVLPGYVLNAMDRSVDEIRSRPYRARPGDECFPSKREPD